MATAAIDDRELRHLNVEQGSVQATIEQVMAGDATKNFATKDYGEAGLHEGSHIVRGRKYWALEVNRHPHVRQCYCRTL